VAEDEGNRLIAGVIRFELVDRLFYEPRLQAVITDLYVRPQYRRRGSGGCSLRRPWTRPGGWGPA